MTPKIRVGTASWADPGFIKDWYPARLAARERLAYYSSRFDFVEVNSSFYAIPPRHLVEQWERATPKGFLFDLKLHKLLSRHACTAALLPADLRPASSSPKDRAPLTAELEIAVARKFLEAVEPLEQASKLGVLLLQMSPAFSPRHHTLEELTPLLGCFRRGGVAVELRNHGWVSERQILATSDYFSGHGVTLVSVDAPESEHFTVMPSRDIITNPSLSYVRLHGRNEKAFISGKSVAERFDYDYSDDELSEVAGRVGLLSQQTEEVHVVFNNNRSDLAPRAAEKFRRLLGQGPVSSGERPHGQRDLRF